MIKYIMPLCVAVITFTLTHILPTAPVDASRKGQLTATVRPLDQSPTLEGLHRRKTHLYKNAFNPPKTRTKCLSRLSKLAIKKTPTLIPLIPVLIPPFTPAHTGVKNHPTPVTARVKGLAIASVSSYSKNTRLNTPIGTGFYQHFIQIYHAISFIIFVTNFEIGTRLITRTQNERDN